MKKKIIQFIIIAIALLVVLYILNIFSHKEDNGVEEIKVNKEETVKPELPDYKNISYKIDGQMVKLTDGVSEVPSAPGSASVTSIKYFGGDLWKDIDGDGREDVTFLITKDTGGSGVFFYAVAALNTVNGYVGVDATLIGDRIAPQAITSGDGRIVVVNYADRKPGEAMTVAPSVGKSLQLLLDTKTMQFGEVANNFEGEADPSRMTLNMKTWNWVKTIYNNDKTVTPNKPDKFTLTFKDGKVSISTDCNSMSATYKVGNDKTISFGPIASTMMYCAGSQETEFSTMLNNVGSYFFTSKGELILGLKYDSGSMTLK